MSKAQKTADDAVSVNSTQNEKLAALEKTSTKAVGGVDFVRRGNVVTAMFTRDVNYTVAAWAGLKVCDIPVGFRPAQGTFSSITYPGGGGRVTAVGTALTVFALDKAISNVNIWGEVTYFTNDA